MKHHSFHTRRVLLFYFILHFQRSFVIISFQWRLGGLTNKQKSETHHIICNCVARQYFMKTILLGSFIDYIDVEEQM